MKRPRKKSEIPLTNWTTDQDCYLIEHSSMSIDELINNLPYSKDEIIARKEVLGLIRRARQMKKRA
ncbi:acyl-CoA thioesterase [Acinetobacter sp. WCHAc060025]|uniref:acyl-CoA thioesterase n=1 Tax=Acinetobacter sp. WCHAc060025 TaxID=2518625 RepID=UPI0010230A67|nr:acyl-CoA thioesterase [Acinetobacter sp. WCHAc060025]RZG76621.1 acyl-CoA thioesterase [Acinetobacter sp. WCHAc060025]